MPRTTLSDIFKSGENFKLAEVDFTDSIHKKDYERIKEEKRKSKLRKIFIPKKEFYLPYSIPEKKQKH